MNTLSTTIDSLAVPEGKLAVLWLGGAAFVLKGPSGRIVAIDPYLSDSLDRYYQWKRLPLSPILVHPHELKPDLVLTTHAHEDHLDPETIPELARASGAPIVGPTQCVALMREWQVPAHQIVELNRGEAATLKGIEVRAVMAHHVSPAGAETPDAVGFVVRLDGVTVYHTGDSLYHAGLAAMAQRPDLMLVCINGQYGNMNPQEAARLTNEIGPASVIPMHWGLVAENTADPADFVAALAETGSRTRSLVLLPGDLAVSAFAHN